MFGVAQPWYDKCAAMLKTAPKWYCGNVPSSPGMIGKDILNSLYQINKSFTSRPGSANSNHYGVGL